jgi:hypothetical protein
MLVGMLETRIYPGWRSDMSGYRLWNPALEPDKSGSEDLTRDKAERPDISEKPLWNPNKVLDKTVWDLAIEELGLGQTCPARATGT